MDELIDQLDANRKDQPWNIGWRYDERGDHWWRINFWNGRKPTEFHRTLSAALKEAVEPRTMME